MSSSPIRICLLTLEKHVADVWVVELQDRLQSAGPPPASVTTMSVESMALELDVGSRLPFDVMVNRVSDAATPRMVKAALTILRSAELDGLLVINGTQAYSVGMSKVLHHVALRKSGLAAPKTLMCGSPPPLPCEVTKQLRFPILLKPNSGGFGAGIVLLEDRPALEAALSSSAEVAATGDGITLLQEYCEPEDGAVFRVWVCGSRIQCAVRVQGAGITGACMSSKCTRKQRRVEAWKPPPDVAEGVLRVMGAAQADLGSVELLYPSSVGQPLYFDVNMLSTLPNPAEVDDPHGLWPTGFDPWKEQADFIMQKACHRQTEQLN